jgi:hypothetical protein
MQMWLGGLNVGVEPQRAKALRANYKEFLSGVLVKVTPFIGSNTELYSSFLYIFMQSQNTFKAG